MSPSADAKPLRRDAARNRAKLVETAAALLRDEGLGVSVNAIARRAGVNVATLYRHFPAKDDLVLAVLEQLLQPLEEARDTAMADAGREVLGPFVRAAAGLQAGHQGLTDVIANQPSNADLRARLREPAEAILAPLVVRAHEEGSLRPDFGAIDVLVALRMLSVLAPYAGAGGPATDRYVDVMLRGLRPG